MAVLTILVVLVTAGVPSLAALLDRNRVRGAAETLASELRYARSEAIAHSLAGDTYVHFKVDAGDATDWCYGLTTRTGCDCEVTDPTAADACVLEVAGTNVLKTVDSRIYRTVEMTGAPASTRFDPVRGVADNGTVTLRSGAGREIRVAVSALGRVRLCSPAGSAHVPGYATEGCP
jgi:Tfp pilus assembly protein FimT